MTRNASLILLYITIAGVTAVTKRPSFSSSTATTEMDESTKDILARLTNINNKMRIKLGPFYDSDGKYSEALKDKIADINTIACWFEDTLHLFPGKPLDKKEKLIKKTKKLARKFARKVDALKKETVHMNDGEFKGMVDFLGTNIVDFRKILNDLNVSLDNLKIYQ